MDILLMTIKAILRRAKIKNDKELVVGNFCMNEEERVATIDGQEINLTVREFDLLFKLLSYPKKTFTRSALMEEFYKSNADFKDYVDKYCIKTGCTVEEALEHALVKSVYEQYKEKVT